MSDFIIQAENLVKEFKLEAGAFARSDKKVYAVNDVSFSIKRGETYALVGESGCGKTTTARMLIGMYKPDSGKILFTPQKNSQAQNISELNRNQLKNYREKVILHKNLP